MHNIESIEHFEGLQKLPKNRECFCLGKVTLFLFFNCVMEGASVTKFIHKIVVVSSLKMVFILDYVFGGSNRGQCFYLVDCALLKLIVLLKLLNGNDFDSKLAHSRCMKSTINLAVSAFSNFLD